MLKQFFRYAIVGALGTAIHMGMLIALVELFRVEPVISSTIGFIVTLIVSYALNYFWTFRSRHPHAYSLPRYAVVSVLGLLLNAAIMYLTVHVLEWWYVLGQLCVVFVVPISNFILNVLWSFRSVHQYEY